jgi:hypothetical protein
MRTTSVLLCCAVLALTACNSGSEEVDDSAGGPPASPAPTPPSPAPTPPSPAPPSPPPPSPPPSPSPPAPTPPAPGNAAPTANAGADKTTVEEQDVTVDGSGTRDPENDALTYAWSLVSAPAGSSAALDVRSASFVFRPDVPGTYELRLTASDGRSSDTDTMRVRAEPLVAFENGGSFKVDRRGDDDDDDDEKHRRSLELELRTSSLYRGEQVAYTAASDAAWLRVVDPSGTTAPRGGETEITVALVMSEVDRLPNGNHEAHVIVTPSGGWERAQATVRLELRGRSSDEIAPYVAYAGTSSFVTVYGHGLADAAGTSVFVGDAQVGTLTVVSDTEATLSLPPLESGVHTLRIGADGEAKRLVVRELPIHRATDLPMPGAASSLEYDAERDAFYGVFVAADGTRSAQRLQNAGTGAWVADVIPVDAARDVALTADGSDLLVSAAGCTIHRLDPATLAVRESVTADICSSEAQAFGALMKLVDGTPVAIDAAADPTLWAFPEGSRTVVPLPNVASFEFGDGAVYVRELR